MNFHLTVGKNSKHPKGCLGLSVTVLAHILYQHVKGLENTLSFFSKYANVQVVRVKECIKVSWYENVNV